jgi:hypothetical protein
LRKNPDSFKRNGNRATPKPSGARNVTRPAICAEPRYRDAIERLLAHGERDHVRAAYSYAEHLSERRKLMQQWANYVDGLRAGAKVVLIKRQAWLGWHLRKQEATARGNCVACRIA